MKKSIHPDVPEEGYYKTRLVRGGPFVPVRIFAGAVHDGEISEWNGRGRCNGLFALRNGDLVRPEWVWPWCANHPIDEAEYKHLMDVRDWALTYAPDEPEANPRQPVKRGAAKAPASNPVDLRTAAIPEF